MTLKELADRAESSADELRAESRALLEERDEARKQQAKAELEVLSLQLLSKSLAGKGMRCLAQSVELDQLRLKVKELTEDCEALKRGVEEKRVAVEVDPLESRAIEAALKWLRWPGDDRDAESPLVELLERIEKRRAKR